MKGGQINRPGPQDTYLGLKGQFFQMVTKFCGAILKCQGLAPSHWFSYCIRLPHPPLMVSLYEGGVVPDKAWHESRTDRPLID